jgi:ribosomal protein S12 methylthiotransferase
MGTESRGDMRGGEGGAKRRAPTISVVNLGCPKNQVDAEVMLGQLAAAGYRIVERPEQAEVIVVNTCGFVQDAKEESIQTILEAASLKRTGRCRALVVSGCLSQRYRQDLPALLPEVDAFIGTGEFPRIAEIVGVTLDRTNRDRVQVSGHTALMTAALPRRRLTPPHVAYLKIAEGCDHSCRFCAIPAIRGPMQSRQREDIVAEARDLVADGVREIVLVSQDTASYGADRGERRGLPLLLRGLLAIPALRWLRLHYLYPTRITSEVITLLADEPRLCRYLDLPLQHADAGVLKAMGRGGSADGFRRLIGRVRKTVPGITVRTSFITGFPGETAAQFAVLARFVKEMRFDRVGVFRYSDEEGTAAVELGPKVPRRVAEARRARLMTVQEQIAEEKGQACINSVQEVLVDGPASEFPEIQCGRTAGHAPEVDGTVYLRGPQVPPGTFVRVRIQEAFQHDLAGEIIEVME